MSLFLYLFMAISLFLGYPLLEAKTTEKKYEVAICALFKNETFYLKEWIEYHKLIGVEHFYLYNNLSTDNYLEVLNPYIQAGLVELFEWPIEVHNQSEYLNLLQLPIYNHALKIAKEETQWMAFIDLDEFICLTAYEDIKNFLKKFKKFGGLAVNWQIYGTSWLEELPQGGLIIEHLVLKASENYPLNQYIKMIVQPQAVQAINNPHFFDFYEDFFAVNGSKKALSPGQAMQPVDIQQIRLNHYWTGTYHWLMKEKLPRRQAWGFHLSCELLENLLLELNKVKDENILKFVPALKKIY